MPAIFATASTSNIESAALKMIDILPRAESDRVMLSEALTSAENRPVADSDSVMESEALFR
jgi:hypothetical protein